MKKVIVTGAAGFVGRWLVSRLLEHNVHVTAVVLEGSPGLALLPKSNQLTVVFCKPEDVLKLPEMIPCHGYDVFYNLAWVGAGGPKRADYTIQLNNVKLCLDYYTSAQKLGCKKFVAIGTIGQYMAQLSMERNIVSENFIYALSKSFCESLLRVQGNGAECKIIWATLTGLYGLGDTTPNLVNYTIKSLLDGVSPTYGPALQPFDFIHISDCVEALYLIGLSKTQENSFLIGSGHPRILKDFLAEIGAIVAPEITMGIGVRPDDGTVYKIEWFDTLTLHKETGFVPKISFAEGIRQTADWLRSLKKEEH